MRDFPKLLKATLGPAAAAGLAVGAVLGRHGLAAGFPLLAVDALRRALSWTLLGTLVFLVLFELLRRPLGRWTPKLAVALASGGAAVPFVALAGYRLNRGLAVRPSELLEPWALVPNAALLLGCGLVWLLVAFLLRRVLDGQRPVCPPPGERAPRAWPAVAAVTLAVVLHAGLFALWRGGEKTRPDVLVLLVDALRADHLGAYGYGRETSPAIDSLARDGVVFRQAIAPSTFTKTSIASLMTGRNPYRHGIYWGQRQLEGDALTADLLADSETTLAEVLAESGYLTAAWVQNSHLRRVMGFGQGFVEYHDQQGSIERIHGRFFPWLDGPGRRYSWFAYLHYIDLHDPYRPAPPYDTLFGTWADVYEGVDFVEWGAYLQAVRDGEEKLSDAEVEQLRALYDGQLRAIDDQVARLLDKLRASGRYDDTLIVLTADHGDAFMEHGFISHSAAPYDELVRVPLIIKLPGGRFAGRTVESQVRLVDVMPTLAAAVGAEVEIEVDGCDLLVHVEGGEPDPRCALAVIEIAEGQIAEGDGEPTLALRTERYKYIHRGSATSELYDLAADPAERHNLVDAPPEDAAPLAALAAELVARRADASESLELDEKTIRELKALGYIGRDGLP